MNAVPATRRAFSRLSRERRVADIIAAARANFTEHGYENASMAAIAEQAGVVEGTIYKYFENKRDLLNQVLASWYEGMVADQADRLAGIAGVRNRLRFVVWSHLRTIATQPALCRVFFTEVRADKDYHASRLHELNRGYAGLASAILQEGIASGELRAGLSVRLVRDMIYGTIEHHTWDYVCGRGELKIDRLADEILGLVLDGARAGAEQQPNVVTDRLERVADRLERLASSAGARPARRAR